LSLPPTDEAAPIAGWRVAGASVAGTAHERAGIACQDAHRWAILSNGCLIIAVADGAGSAARSGEGAQCAVEAAETTLSHLLEDGPPIDDQAWREAIAATLEAALAAVDTHAEGMNTPVRDFATTLTVVAATAEHLAVGQVGDGVAVAEGADGLFLAVAPQRGEYANEVSLLTSPQAVEGAAIVTFPAAVRALTVTTDGLLRLAVRLPSHAPHAPFFRPLFAFLAETADLTTAGEELARFLASERVCDRTDDDKTLVLAIHVARDGNEETPTTPPTEMSQTG
jgi:serine/threonine protein phosphatase PrpC